MRSNPPYILDSNVFIEAHRRYYHFDICPGYWDSLIYFHRQGLIASLDVVARELEGEDTLWEWVEANVPNGFFLASSQPEIVEEYRKLIDWVQAEKQYLEHAKTEFASAADGWLVAYGLATGATVVSQETIARDAKKRIPLPNICEAFEVDSMDTFEMLRALNAKYRWVEPE